LGANVLKLFEIENVILTLRRALDHVIVGFANAYSLRLSDIDGEVVIFKPL